MTTNETIQKYRSHRRERRHIPPFGDGERPNSVSNFLDGLLECKFAPFHNQSLMDVDRYVLSPDELGKSLAPQFAIAVARADGLPSALGASVEDFNLGISVRNRHAREYRVLARWSLSDMPVTWKPDATDLEDLQTGRGMDFVISVIVSADRRKLAQLGMNPGKVVVRKEISVREPREPASLNFPIEWIEFGGESGYPKESLWHIYWKDDAIDVDSESPFEVPVEQALIIYMNKAAKPQLDALAKSADGLTWRILAADITTHVCAVVLNETQIEPNESDTDTLAGQIFARLSETSHAPYSELLQQVETDYRLDELRHWVDQLCEVVK